MSRQDNKEDRTPVEDYMRWGSWIVHNAPSERLKKAAMVFVLQHHPLGYNSNFLPGCVQVTDMSNYEQLPIKATDALVVFEEIPIDISPDYIQVAAVMLEQPFGALITFTGVYLRRNVAIAMLGQTLFDEDEVLTFTLVRMPQTDELPRYTLETNWISPEE